MAALLLVLLLAPGDAPAHRLAYRFDKGMVYEEASRSEVKLHLFGGATPQQHLVLEQVLERKVMELDAEGRPAVERIVVRKWIANFLAGPGASGEKSNEAQGLTFVWRVKRDGEWGLFDRKREVTDKHPGLVERLRGWRGARLPAEPVATGATWKVDARTFLLAAGQTVPPDVQGEATFTLEGVEDSVATISFDMKMSFQDGERAASGVQTGTWRFDLTRGRDLSFVVHGRVEIDKGQTGFYTAKLERTVTYP